MGKKVNEMSEISKNLGRKKNRYGALAVLYLVLGGLCTGLAVANGRKLGQAESSKYWTDETAKVIAPYDTDEDSSEESEGS